MTMNLRQKTCDTERNGQSIVELLIAVSTVIIAILGILTLVNRSLGLNRLNSDHYTATYLASEGIELAKNFFDRTYLDGVGSGEYGFGFGGLGAYELDYTDTDFDSGAIVCGKAIPPIAKNVEDAVFECTTPLSFSSGFFSYDSGEKSKFRRIIIIDVDDSYPQNDPVYEYRVTSVVGWESRGGKFTVHLQDHFLTWRLP